MRNEIKTNPSCDFISRADAIEAIASAEPKDNEYHYYKHIAIKILSEIPSIEVVSEDTQIEEQARFATKETELAHIEARLKNAEKRLQGACVANFVAEQLERLKDMTDEERLKLLQTMFPSVDVVMRDATAEERASVQRYIDSISIDAVQGWIPFTRRPMTKEEQKDFPNCTFMFDCVLPDDGDEILVSNRRFVWMDTFCSDIDGCYLDSGDDIDEDMAWMPLPKPYKGDDSE